jgi:hypothetical protein
MADTLREFLIKLDWKTDEIQRDQRHFERAIESATLKASLLADLLVAMAQKIASAVQEAATRFDNLYNAARRLGTTAAFANDFPVLIKKYGGNAAEATSLLEAAATRLKDNSNNIVNLNKLGFGLDATTGKLSIQKEMLSNLRNLSDQQIESLTSILGIPDQPILLMKRHLDEILPDLKAMEDYRQRLGLNIEQAAKEGNIFASIWRDIKMKLDNIGAAINAGLTVAFMPLMTELHKFINLYAKDITDAIMLVVNALTEMLRTWTADFDKVLADPNAVQPFSKGIKELAENVAFLTRKMSDFIGVLKSIFSLPDVLNYLSGNTKDIESYNRGKGLLNTPGNPYYDANRAINPTTEDIVKGADKEKNAPEWGPAKRFREWFKDKFGGSSKTTAPAAPATVGGGAGATPNTVVFGDSIGEGLARALQADRSNAVQGMNPEWVRARIAAYKQSLAGKDVVISSGASNDVRNAATVKDQIAAALAKGADPKRITVLGVGSLKSALGFYPGVSEEVNATLKSAAAKAGVSFLELPARTDVHPDYHLLAGALAKAASVPRAAPPAPLAPPAATIAPPPPPFAPLVPFVAPAPLSVPAPVLGGGHSGPHPHINLPSKNVIHVDGTGDPAAVAGLVQKAQKGVNENLSKTLYESVP